MLWLSLISAIKVFRYRCNRATCCNWRRWWSWVVKFSRDDDKSLLRTSSQVIGFNARWPRSFFFVRKILAPAMSYSQFERCHMQLAISHCESGVYVYRFTKLARHCRGIAHRHTRNWDYHFVRPLAFSSVKSSITYMINGLQSIPHCLCFKRACFHHSIKYLNTRKMTVWLIFVAFARK